MERERSTARRNSAERNWPTLSPTEQSDRAAGGKSGAEKWPVCKRNQKEGRRRRWKRPEKSCGREKRKRPEKSCGREKRKRPEKSGRREKRTEKSCGRRKPAAEKGAKPAGGYDNSIGNERNRIHKFSAGRSKSGYSRATGGQNRAQGHSTAAGGRTGLRDTARLQETGIELRVTAQLQEAGIELRVTARLQEASVVFRAAIRERMSCRRMQNRHTQNRKTSQAKRRHSARRSRHLIYAGMAAVCVLVLFLAAGRIGKRNSAEASGQSDMILAENKKSADGTGLEAANVSDTGEGGTAPSDIPAKSWTNHLPDIGAMYGIYVNQVGWSHFFADNSYCMAPVNQFITAFRATVHNQPEDMTGTIAYRVNLSGKRLAGLG